MTRGRESIKGQDVLPANLYRLYLAFITGIDSFDTELDVQQQHDLLYFGVVQHLLDHSVDIARVADYCEGLHKAKLRYLLGLDSVKYAGWRKYANS